MIRSRTAHDMTACVTVLAEVHRADGYPSRWPADPATWLHPPGLRGAWVAESETRITGHVALRDGASDTDAELASAVGAEPAHLLVLARLFVSATARGTGAAQALVRTAADHAAAMQRPVALDVVDDAGPAIALYERLGWRRAGTGTATWLAEGNVHPTVHYYVAPNASRDQPDPRESAERG